VRASDANTTREASADSTAATLSRSESAPAELTLTSSTPRVTRSSRYTSLRWFVSIASSAAGVPKASQRPSADSEVPSPNEIWTREPSLVVAGSFAPVSRSCTRNPLVDAGNAPTA